MKKLELNILGKGVTGLTPINGSFLSEAAAVCLNHNGHLPVVGLSGEGYYPDSYELTCDQLHPAAIDSFADLQEAAQFGAAGIALAVFFSETSWVMKRSYKGTGFDYWLGSSDEQFPFQNKARLEVSGILNGTQAQINTRLREKLEQTKVSDDLNLPAYAAVVEFSNPKILTAKR